MDCVRNSESQSLHSANVFSFSFLRAREGIWLSALSCSLWGGPSTPVGPWAEAGPVRPLGHPSTPSSYETQD